MTRIAPLLALVFVAGCGSIEYGPSEPRARRVQPAPVAADPVRVDGAFACGGQQRLRIDDQVLDGGDGPAVRASGQCVVEISESVVRGQPAVVVQDQARVVLVECNIQGDMITRGQAQVQTRGSRHRGQLLQAGY